jgi:hypothetical protein
MNAETFKEWLQRQGHKIYKTHSSYWYDAGPRVLQAFPYHWLIKPDDNEIHTLMLKHRIIALRYSAPPDYHKGKMSYHIVQKNCYNIDMLKQQTRNGVKCGLKNFSVKPITFERLAREGWVLQEDTLARQNRLGSMKQNEWELLCKAAEDLPGFETFAAVKNEVLAGAVIVCRIDDIYSVPYAMSHCRFLHDHVNNALFYSVCCELLKRENVNKVFFTVESLDAPEHVDEFKLRMGFEAMAVRQCVEIHPYLEPFVVPAVHVLTRQLLQHSPTNTQLSKAEGILRFFFEGKRPINKQSLPHCLALGK